MLSAADAEPVVTGCMSHHLVMVNKTRNAPLVPFAAGELTQLEHALPHRTRCAQGAKIAPEMQVKLALQPHPESRAISPSQSWRGGPPFTTSCRATTRSRTKSTVTRAKETGCSWVARGPQVPTRLFWEPSAAELTCSSRLAAQALLTRTTPSSGTTNPENPWVSHP